MRTSVIHALIQPVLCQVVSWRRRCLAVVGAWRTEIAAARWSLCRLALVEFGQVSLVQPNTWLPARGAIRAAEGGPLPLFRVVKAYAERAFPHAGCPGAAEIAHR